MTTKKEHKVRRGRTAVPHTHLRLVKLGAFRALLPQETSEDREGDYQSTFRILFAGGYTPLQATSLGFLRLARKSSADGKTFSLTVDRCMQNPKDELHHLHMELECRRDALATPLEGRLTSRYIGPDGSVLSALNQNERFALHEGELEYHHGSSPYREPSPGPHAHTWGLFEAVARLPMEATPLRPFSLLDGTDIVKPHQQLGYAGSETSTSGAAIHSFAQLGSGILPTEYFLDDAHRLLSVVTSARVYVREELMAEAMNGPIKAAYAKGNYQ